MDQQELKILSDKEIPEVVRAKMADIIFQRHELAKDRELELLRINSDRSRAIWNTPFVAALAGLLTLSATFLFDRMSETSNLENTLSLEQVRNELNLVEARLMQELEVETSKNLANIEAAAREREFQFEVIRAELNREGLSNEQRALILLFLTRAGVLSALNEEELTKIAEEQRNNPDEEIIPSLSELEPHWRQGKMVSCDDGSLRVMINAKYFSAIPVSIGKNDNGKCEIRVLHASESSQPKQELATAYCANGATFIGPKDFRTIESDLLREPCFLRVRPPGMYQ